MSAEETTTSTPDQSTQATDQSRSTTSSDSQDTQQNKGQASDQAAGDTNTDAGASTTNNATEETTAQEEYELELAEDSPLSETDFDEIVEEAVRLKLSKDDATKLIQAREKAYKAGETKVISAYQAKIEASRKEIMADPMFSKENAPVTFASMSRAVETFGDEDMVKLVQSAEFGNNVVLARFLKRLGDALAPDEKSMTGGKGSAGQAKTDGNDGLRNLYPDFFKNENK